MAETIGVQPDENRTVRVRIGGESRKVCFQDVRMRLCAPNEAAGCVEWEAQVGFFMRWGDPPWLVLLGQVGFFDRFTVTMSRLAQRLSVGEQEEFDNRHPPGARAARVPARPRFMP
jgi:hypothetical protein